VQRHLCGQLQQYHTGSIAETERLHDLSADCWHANVLEVYGVVVAPPYSYVVMELAPNGKLQLPFCQGSQRLLRILRDVARVCCHLNTLHFSAAHLRPEDFTIVGSAIEACDGAWDVKLSKAVLHEVLSKQEEADALRELLTLLSLPAPPPLDLFGGESSEALYLRLVNALCPLACVTDHQSHLSSCVDGVVWFASELDSDVCTVEKHCEGDRKNSEVMSTLSTTTSLGSGAFGSVMQTTAAIREISLNVAAKTVEDAPFGVSYEAKLMSRILPHPNVVKLHGQYTESNETAEIDVYLLMTLVKNHATADAFLSNFDSADHGHAAFTVLLDIASALKHLHSHVPPIVHRDIAPRNCLVEMQSGSNTAYLCDFGLSRQTSAGQYVGGLQAYQRPLTRCPKEWHYMGEWSTASDVYMFALMVTELLTRQPLWSDLNDSAMTQLQTGLLRPAQLPADSNMAHIQHVIDACLDSDPASRPSMPALHDGLAAAIQVRISPLCPGFNAVNVVTV